MSPLDTIIGGIYEEYQKGRWYMAELSVGKWNINGEDVIDKKYTFWHYHARIN